MCGICGLFRFNGSIDATDVQTARLMNKKLLHRGPDEQKVLVSDDFAFGFNRLSIIGLSNGMQPITNEDASVVLICNGEIFNYLELKQELISKSHRFQTDSDVEVLLHLYEEYGIDFFEKINGQFAFAIYDKKIKTLFCARDHMGIAPLYYTRTSNSFIFASEIKSILEHPEVRRELDLVGLDQVFSFPGLVSPRTMFKGIHSLRSGHYLRVGREGDVSETEYWDLTFPEKKMYEDKNELFFIERLGDLFENSIRLRLRADVQNGIYLSGGLDSSMIAMMINKVKPGFRQKAFSIHFVDSKISENKYQKVVAQASNSDLYSQTFFNADIADRLKQSVYHSECPVKETYNTASLALSEAVKSNNIKFVLSGEGADELFAGYVGYKFDKIRSQTGWKGSEKAFQTGEYGNFWGDESIFYEQDFSSLTAIKRQLYSDGVLASFKEVNCLNYPVIDTKKIKDLDDLNRRSYLDFKLRLVDHLVSDHGDRMALANSIEVRYPFLDRHLVEFAALVPARYKLKDFEEKYILKRLAAQFVPDMVVKREKFGFHAPGSPYLLQNNIEYINDILSYDLIKKQGYFNPNYIENLKSCYSKPGFSLNVPFENDILITVITFGILLEKYFS